MVLVPLVLHPDVYDESDFFRLQVLDEFRAGSAGEAKVMEIWIQFDGLYIGGCSVAFEGG